MLRHKFKKIDPNAVDNLSGSSARPEGWVLEDDLVLSIGTTCHSRLVRVVGS